MSYLLHIDTSTEVALYMLSQSGKLLFFRQNNVGRDHAATINVHINEMLKEAAVAMGQLSGVVVCGGPGSYTGLRIGLATAKGYCFALDIPLVMQNRLELIAKQHAASMGNKFQKYIVLRYAREGEYFAYACDQRAITLFPANHIASDSINDLLAEGSSCMIIADKMTMELQRYAENIYVEISDALDLQHWGRSGYLEYDSNNTVNLSTVEPFYLKQVYTHTSMKNNKV